MKKTITLLFCLIALAGFSQVTLTENQGIYLDKDGKPYTGTYIEYYSPNKPKIEMLLLQGKLNGITKTFFESGKINEIRSYSEGKTNGKWETFNEQGVKTAEANFQMGEKHGKWFIWDDNGTLRYDMNYTNGKRNGVWIIYNEKGEKISEKNYEE